MVNYRSTATILLSLLSTSSATTTTNNNGNGAKFNLRKRIIGRPINTNNQHKLTRRQHDDTTDAAIEQEQYHRTLQLQENSMSIPPLQQSQLIIDGSPEGEPVVGPPANLTQIEQAAWWDSFLGGNSGVAGTPYPTYYPTYSPTSADVEEEEVTDTPVSSPVSEAPISSEPTESVAKATATDSPSTPPVSTSPSTPPVSSAPVSSAPVTSTPTSTPITSSPITPYPTYSPTIDPPLLTKANNLGSIFGPGMYTECQGDCDTHSDCLGDNYMCFYRDDNEVVPGCDNESAVRGIDYCVERTNEILQEIESDLAEGGYGRCEGNCNSDSDCQGELLCQERNGWDLIYGCVGWGEEDVNYCREKTDDEKVGQLLITDVYSGIIMNSNEVVETEEEEPVAGGVAPSTEVSSPVDKRTPKVIKLMDDTSSYFVGYNGKQVTITKIDKETDEISLDGVVLNSDDTHVISNWKNGTDLVISASEMEDGYASIDIQLQEAEPPSLSPEMSPTGGPSTLTPSGGPSTLSPSGEPSTLSPTKLPTTSPTTSPTPVPTATPSLSPSSSPTKEPSTSPTESPSFSPTKNPTASPTLACDNTICELELFENPETCPTDCIFRNYITRNYERNEKSNGQMFTVSASDKVTIGYLGIVAEKDGNSDIQVYTKSGSHTGFEEDETAWTLVFDNTVSVIKESFTSLKLDNEITIGAGSSQAFYIFSKVGLLYHKVGKRRELEKGLTLTFDADEDTEEVEPTIAEAKNDKNQDEGDVVPAVVTTVGDSTITISQMVSTKKLFKDVQNVVAVYTGGISYYMSARDVA